MADKTIFTAKVVALKKEKKIIEGVKVETVSSDGRGISRLDGKVIFTDFAVPGDVIDISIHRSKKSYSEGRIDKIQSASFLRTQPRCSHFMVCGGCKWQQVKYEEQLSFKKQIVEDAFRKIGKVDFDSIPDVIGCENDYYYRNKLEFAFTDRKWITDEEVQAGIAFEHRNGVGFHVPGSFSGVVDVDHCFLQPDPSNQIRIAIKEFALENGYTFFDLKNQKGLLRNLLIRITSTGEILVLISFYEKKEEKIFQLLGFVQEKFPEITALQYVINPKRNDTIYDLPVSVFYGKSYITEMLGDYSFKIGPKSFFQTNSLQAKVLYDIVKDFAQLREADVVYDLYTGVGSIGLYVSDKCKKVVGIEQIEEAIIDAKENALLNKVQNCEFYAGDVRMILKDEFMATHGKPDVVITDPPRAGMHEDVVKTLLALEAPAIVYVSCNAATQARDLQLLSEKYTVTRIQPVDMFPHTTHIENVVRLQLKKEE